MAAACAGHSTVLMCMDVTKLLPPLQTAYLRSSGHVGARGFLEVSEMECVPILVHLPQGTEDVRHSQEHLLDDALTTAPVGSNPCGSGETAIYIERMVISVAMLRASMRTVSSAVWATFAVDHLECVMCDDLTAASRIARSIQPRSVGFSNEVKAANPFVVSAKVVMSSATLATSSTVDGEERGTVTGSPTDEAILLGGSVVTVPKDFMAFSGALRVYLSPALDGVKRVCHGMLMSCPHLTEIDLDSLSEVTDVGLCFLEGCSALKCINLNSLRNVTQLGECFLSGCTSLTVVDLTPLKSLQSVGGSFMARCSGITHLDVSPLFRVQTLGTNFLLGCSNLQTLRFPELFDHVTALESGFLQSCSSLAGVSLGAFGRVTVIEGPCFDQCLALRKVDFTPMRKLCRIQPPLLGMCRGLERVDMSSLSELQWIDPGTKSIGGLLLPTHLQDGM